MKRLFSILLASLLVWMMVPACAEEPVRVLTNVTGGKDEVEMTLFSQAVSKAVGFPVVFEKPADYGTTVMQKLMAGEVYDMFYLNESAIPTFLEMGALTDLTDRIAASKILSDPAVIPTSEWEMIRQSDGKFYTLFNKKELHRVVNIDRVVAKEAGIDVEAIEPTLAGYEAVFQSMAALKKEHFYPFMTLISQLYDLQPWFASVNLKGGIVMQDGKKTVPWATDEAAPVWEWLASLYAQGLMDPDGLTGNTKMLREKFGYSNVGCVVDWAAWTGLYNTINGERYPDAFEAYPLPGVKGENYMLTRGEASLWAVPANARYPERAVQIVEYFTSQEGATLLTIGIEGYDYNMVDGKVIMTDIGKAHSNDHGAPTPINSQYVHPFEWNPGFATALSYLPYASTELNMGELTTKYKEIAGKYGVRMVSGEISVLDGLKAMREEMTAAGVID